MNRQQSLKEMIKYRDLRGNECDEEKFEAYISAWEIVIDLDELNSEEIPIVVASFFNKPSYPEYIHPLIDLVVLSIKTKDDFDIFVDSILKNKEGIYESLQVLDALLDYKKEYINYFAMKMRELKEEKYSNCSWFFLELSRYEKKYGEIG